LRAFLDRQTRHPNRRVDAAVTATEWSAALDAQGAGGPRWREQGTVGLDFRVTENKPWSVLVQGSNTGIESTGKWQTRVGYFNSDLFGNDEIFSLEFVTTNLEDSNTVSAYFDAPIGESEHLRWKLFAGHSEYTASDVGFVFADFEGESPRVGGELAWNVAQWGKTFLDLVGGVTWTNVEALNGLTRDRGDESFLVPYIGARLQRNDRGAVTDFSLNLEFGFGEGSRIVELNRLGRLFPDSEWQVLRWDFAQSFYLDPWFQDKADLATATLAHELYFRFHGQNSLGHRLVPQFMGTAGGFYTVRGYPTSVAAGDNVYIFTGEYRLHLPQLLGFDANPQPFMGIGTEPFRLRPQFGYGPTDWDLIFRAFVDAAVVRNVNRFSFETDEELIGAGFGVELQMQKGIGHPVLRNLSLRLDVGYPLKDLDFVEVDDVQVTFVGSLAF
jgi:hemolysin activation/secretion protein